MNTPESRGPVRVLIVDDHPVVRAGLASLLRRQSGVKLCGAAHSGEEAMQVLKRMSVDVILLDLRMPTINGIDLLNLLKAEADPPRAIILSSYELEEEIYRAVQAGLEAISRRMRPAKKSSLPLRQWQAVALTSLPESQNGCRSATLDPA